MSFQIGKKKPVIGAQRSAKEFKRTPPQLPPVPAMGESMKVIIEKLNQIEQRLAKVEFNVGYDLERVHFRLYEQIDSLAEMISTIR